MIVYPNFVFAAPPGTPAWSVVEVFESCDLVNRAGVEPFLPPDVWDGLSLSIVMHPFDWLLSFYQKKDFAFGIKEVDEFNHLRDRCTFVEFVKRCRQSPGCIGRLFGLYPATSILRIEDFPWALIEFMDMVGVTSIDVKKVQTILDKAYAVEGKETRDPTLRREVLEAESEICTWYEYCHP